MLRAAISSNYSEGLKKAVAALRELLGNPGRGPIPFYAALSFIAHLEPADALEQLEARAGLLAAEVAGMDAVIREMVPKIGRLPMSTYGEGGGSPVICSGRWK